MNNKPRRRTFTAGQFIAHPRAMVESPAMRALSLAARKALDRIEIEHMNHGGAQNGQLPVTYRDFEAWGIRRTASPPPSGNLRRSVSSKLRGAATGAAQNCARRATTA